LHQKILILQFSKMPLHRATARICFLTSILCLLYMGGCTRPPEGDANRIRFAFWGSIQQQRAEEAIIRAFQEENPDIKVDTLVVGARYPQKMQAMMVGHVAPDVFLVRIMEYEEWASRGVLKDVTDSFRRLHEESPFMPIPRKTFDRQDGIFALPTNTHGVVTFYNQQAFEAAGIVLPEEGITWDWLLEVGPQLARQSGNPEAPTDYALYMPPLQTAFWQRGVFLFDDPFNPQEVTVNRPGAIEAIKFLRHLQTSGIAVPPEVAQDEGTFQLFRDGRVATYFTGRWMTPEFDGRTDFTWDVIPFPEGPNSAITYHGGTSLAIWEHTPREEAARRFLEFYASPSGAAVAMQYQRTVPVFRELAYSEEFLSMRPPESMEVFTETMEEGASRTNLYAPGSQEVFRLLQGRIQQSLASLDIPAGQIIQGLEEDLNRWLERRERRERRN